MPMSQDNDQDDIVLSELPDDELVEQMHDDLYDGLAEEIAEGTQILLDRGWEATRVLEEALVGGMTIVGNDFRDGILFVPEVLLAANAMKGGMAILKPLLAETGAPVANLMVMGEAVRNRPKVPRTEVRETILALCRGRFLTTRDLARYLGRSVTYLRNHFIGQMIRDQVLELKYPDEPSHRDQAYRRRGGEFACEGQIDRQRRQPLARVLRRHPLQCPAVSAGTRRGAFVD